MTSNVINLYLFFINSNFFRSDWPGSTRSGSGQFGSGQEAWVTGRIGSQKVSPVHISSVDCVTV